MENWILLCNLPLCPFQFTLPTALFTKNGNGTYFRTPRFIRSFSGKATGQTTHFAFLFPFRLRAGAKFAPIAGNYTKFLTLHRCERNPHSVGKACGFWFPKRYEQFFHILLRTHVEKWTFSLSTMEKYRETLTKQMYFTPNRSFSAIHPHRIHSLPTPTYAVSTSC